MKIVINEIDAFIAVLSFTAKCDVRAYLEGIRIEPKKNRVVATDGHTAAYAEIIEKCDIKSPISVFFADKIIHKKTKSILITDDCITCFSSEIHAPTYRLKIIPSRIDEGSYPDVDKALKQKGRKKKISEIALNPEYLKRIAIASKNKSEIKMKFVSEDQRVEINFTHPSLAPVKAFVMPMRLDQ